MLVKGWPIGSVGPGGATDGSTRLVSSIIEGARQPLRPPTILFVTHVSVALSQFTWLLDGDLSHTSPVSLSRTASLLKSARTVKRALLGSFLSQFCVTPES